MTSFPKLYPITSDSPAASDHVAQAEAMLNAGAKIIQLRDKTLSSKDLYEQAVRLSELCRSHGARLIVNDRVDIAIASNADGVHLGQDDLPASEARELLGEGVLIGISTHSAEQARVAAREPVDYIAIGPVFRTRTKQNPDPVVGLEGVAEAKTVAGDLPLVAIGGITSENFRSVLSSGADSVAVISEIALAEEGIEAAVKRFLAPARR